MFLEPRSERLDKSESDCRDFHDRAVRAEHRLQEILDRHRSEEV